MNPRSFEPTARKDQHTSVEYSESKQKQYLNYLCKLRTEFEERYNSPSPSTMSAKDFIKLRTLGTGAFGRVVLLQHKKSNVFYAMKILEKEKIVKFKQIEHTYNEKKILESIRFPLVVHMELNFKDNDYIYFVMPFVMGGEMFTHLRKMGKYDESLGRFYASQVILALEYLHYCNLVYRDLKPENILIDRTGYLKITDFGFCKILKGRTWTLCGTPEYLAPEIILSKGYGCSVDWWSFGILVYEMHAGYPPFFANDPMKIYEKIVSGKYRCPSHFSSDLRDLIKNILQTDVTRRFGVLKNGTLDFKLHKWFRTTDWDGIVNGRVAPLFIPRYKSPGDCINFDKFDEPSMKISSKCKYETEFIDF